MFDSNDWPHNFIEAVLGERLTIEPNDLYASVAYIIYSLEDQESDVIIARFKDGLSFSEIGKKYNVTGERIREIEHRAITRLTRNPFYSKILRYGVKGYSDMEVKCKLEDHVDSALKPFLNGELKEIINIIDDLKAHADNFTTAPYISCYSEDKPIAELEFSVRVYNCLTRSGVRTIRDILNKEEDILHGYVRNLGNRGKEELINKMREFGFNNFGKEYK